MIRLGAILIFLVGLGFFSYSLKMKYYTSDSAHEKLDMDTADAIYSDGANSDKARANYYREVEKLRTNKAAYEDLGSGLMIASGLCLLFLLCYKVKRASDFKKIVSFNKQWMYFTAIPVWLLLIPGTYWFYALRLERHDYPSWADSILIPIMGNSITILLGSILLVIFLALTTKKALLPTSLVVKYDQYDLKNILWEVLWALLVLLNIFILIDFIISGDHISIAVNLYFTFLLFTIRAGRINYALNNA